MLKEYVAEILNRQEVLDMIQQLAQQERIIESNRGRRGDRDRLRTAERLASQLRSSLLQSADPSALYHFIKTTGIANADELRAVWQSAVQKADVWKEIPFASDHPVLRDWFQPVLPDLKEFPVGSFVISIPFWLSKPFLTKDDLDFYIIDNPIQREKNFRFPMIRSTSWKGSLRSAFWQLGYLENDDSVIRLFGSPRAEEENFIAGRLQFYSSFFTQRGLEIINPHDRETKTGKNPILIETVSQGAYSTFTLFYFPFDRIGEDKKETVIRALGDLTLVSEGIQAMLTIYGFGAKTSSGFGVANNSMPKNQVGRFWIRLYLADGSETVVDLDFNSLNLMVRKSRALNNQIVAQLGEGS